MQRGQGHGRRPERAARRATTAARTPSEQFAEFMDKHGAVLPGQPADLEELVDSLARRAAAQERMMAGALARAARRAGRT